MTCNGEISRNRLHERGYEGLRAVAAVAALRLGRLAGCLVAALVTATAAHAEEANIVLVDGGVSRHCIYHDPDAPRSVALAADEIRNYVKKAAGIELAVVANATPPACPLISLGVNAASKRAGLHLNDVPAGGYRIATRNDAIYLLGVDTLDGGITETGGTSDGTLNAAYTFLEDFFGVRWLMPGDVGEHVPQKRTVSLPANLDHVDRPGFASRRIAYIQNNNPLVAEWLRRQKQGASIQLRHGHAWQDLIRPSEFKAHPEWFAMIGAVRSPPADDRFKLETTNPELVKTIAERVVAQFRQSPRKLSASISPSDSGNWSTSPESLALYERDPLGRTSVTPLILSFYTNVARLVGNQMPRREVCGYIYADYLYPPKAGIPELPPNLCLVVAPHISYGYGLHNPALREQWQRLIDAWSAPDRTRVYYDLPTAFFPDAGIPHPPGFDLLKFIYPRIHRAGYKGIYIYGMSGWGHGAITNYLLAKLNWNPNANVDHLVEEFFRLSYGPRAGVAIRSLYQRLDGANAAYRQGEGRASETLDANVLAAVYAAAMPHMAFYMQQAREATTSEKERLRLAMFELSFNDLQRRMAQLKLLNPSTPVDVGIAENGETRLPLSRPDIALAIAKDRQHPPRLKVAEVRASLAAPFREDTPTAASRPPMLRGDATLLMLPIHDGPVSVTINHSGKEENPRYALYDAERELIFQGEFTSGNAATFQGYSGQMLFLRIRAASEAYTLEVSGARFAVSTKTQPKGVEYHNRFPITYFHVPEHIRSFEMTVSTEHLSETAAADITDPYGKVAGSFDTSGQLVVRSIVSNVQGGGFWSIKWKKPKSGANDDVWVKLDERIPPWVVLDPRKPLLIEKPQ